MIPRHYLDFVVAVDRGEDARETRERGGGLPEPVIASAALTVLHGVFKARPGRYALALPRHADRPFAVLRVFTGEREDLDELVEAVERHPVIRDYLWIGYPRRVPATFEGSCTEFRRYRIPSRRSGRKPDDDLRERRMAHAETGRLPYFILHSESTGQQFGLYVEIRPFVAPVFQPGEWTFPDAPGVGAFPDSYGLSVSSRPFALPDLP